ncbi:helix-turn-helix domain-containing protein [Synechococcus sp. LA31]|uniref:helix-turn-helix domain-containing protein n=1 Tax=Synechococcus sp. LA31 TaxID=2741953 RepID=UPI001BDD8858|nr:helix-turn-helix domain-containing protein [Synechococcus sp. LA31]QVV66775.1 helix-turn-helix domain-containing protein [Synechococcus sp. LA31]
MSIKPLTPRQANALQMTLDGFTKTEIQERLGINQATLWRWRKLPAWDEQVSIVLRDSSGDGQGQIKSMLPLATRRLKQLIHSPTETVALGACRTVLEAHANLVAREEQQQVLADLETRLEELQDAARNQGLLPHGQEAEVLDLELEEGPDSCVPAIPTGTQGAEQASADQDVQIAAAADCGQMDRIGQRSGPVGQDHPDLEAF